MDLKLNLYLESVKYKFPFAIQSDTTWFTLIFVTVTYK